MNTSIIPAVSRSESKKKYVNNIEGWKNFAYRITKNPFVKKFLLERDGENCSWCNKGMNENFVVHHVSYDHCCTFKKVTVVSTPVPSNSYSYQIVPDCKHCKERNEKRFLECMNKLALVHIFCNKEIAVPRKHILQSQQGSDSSADI